MNPARSAEDSPTTAARLSPLPGPSPLTWRRAAAVVVLNVAAGLLSLAVGHYGGAWSRSVVASSLVTLGWVALIGLLSYLEALSVRQLMLRGGWRGGAEIRDLAASPPQPWRHLHLPLTIAILALLGLNMLAWDRVAQGFFIDQQKTHYALTRIRSADPVMQRQGILAAVELPNLTIRQGLVEALSRPGDLPWRAAWALGQVGTAQEAPALMHLLHQGHDREKAAAAVALGRLHHEPLASALRPLARRPLAPLESYLVALGWLGRPAATPLLVDLLHDDLTAPDHLALAAWALGRVNDHGACDPLRSLLSAEANPLTCATSYSLARLTCPESLPELEQAFDAAPAESRCDRYSFADADRQPIELWPSGLYRLFLLRAMIRVGPDGAAGLLRRIANDGSQVPQLREEARGALSDLGQTGPED